MATILLLIISNVFMTFAWYGHLRHREGALWKVILISWLIALQEYLFHLPANRIGYGTFSAIELTTIQEVITLTPFSLFSTFYLGEQNKWNHNCGFRLILAAVYVTFKEW